MVAKRYIKYICLSAGLLLSTNIATSQEYCSITLPMANVDDTARRAETPMWQWRCTNGDAILNYNPAITVDRDHALTFDSIPYADRYTIIVVYKPIIDTEAMVWRLNYDSASVRGLTTERIFFDSVFIRHADTTTGTPVINTLSQSAPYSTSPYISLTVGGDTLSGKIKIAEILYFDHRLDNSMLRRIQSALAVRYGITLAPVDYVNGDGNTIWNHTDDGQFHHRVTGIGRDSTYGVYQLQSRSEMTSSLLTISTDSLDEGVFMICGDNDAPLYFETDGEVEQLNRKWKINCNSVDDRFFHLIFDLRDLSTDFDSLVLLVDESAYLPYSVSSEEVVYKYVMFSTDTSMFTLARGSIFWQMVTSNGGSNNGIHCNTRTSGASKSFVYPNPTSGEYTIEVSGASWVKVEIYDTHGRLMNGCVDSNKEHYFFNGNLPAGNSYYATITTENGIQTLKLIVK